MRIFKSLAFLLLANERAHSRLSLLFKSVRDWSCTFCDLCHVRNVKSTLCLEITFGLIYIPPFRIVIPQYGIVNQRVMVLT